MAVTKLDRLDWPNNMIDTPLMLRAITGAEQDPAFTYKGVMRLPEFGSSGESGARYSTQLTHCAHQYARTPRGCGVRLECRHGICTYWATRQRVRGQSAVCDHKAAETPAMKIGTYVGV